MFFSRQMIFFLLLFLSFNNRSFACASCGSGGDDPMILYPWEDLKVYAGFARTSGFTLIDGAGREGMQLAPDTRNTTTISVGRTLSNRFFATLTAPYIVNKRNAFERSGWGDLLVSARYTILAQDISLEWQPQVQLIGGLRSGKATSVYDYRDPAMLDVFGSGVPEARLGVDVWHGMFDWKAGVAQTITAPLNARQSSIGVVRNGMTLRSTVTLGYGWGELAKLLVGVNREQTTRKTIDGKLWDESDTLSHNIFISADAKVQEHSTLRLTISKAAAIGASKNTTRSDMVTLSMMRAI